MGQICCASNKQDSRLPIECSKVQIKNTSLLIIYGQITDQKVDVIVNSTCTNLEFRKGVGQDFLKKGGSAIKQQCQDYISNFGPVPIGSIVITGPGLLQCSKIVHVVAPVYVDGTKGQSNYLKLAIQKAIQAAEGFSSISLNTISTGIFCYPQNECIQLHLTTIKQYLDTHQQTTLRQIRIVDIHRPTVALLIEQLEVLVPFSIKVESNQEQEESPQLARSNTDRFLHHFEPFNE